GWRTWLRLPRDHYVRLDGNDYSVHPGVIGRRVEVLADLDRVRVLCDGRVVADHERLWAKHQTMSDPDHLAAAKLLRQQHTCLHREVSARASHGGEGRIRAARFPARKSLEEFDYDHARGLKRDTIAHLGTLDFVTTKDNVVFLGPPVIKGSRDCRFSVINDTT